jgi:SAM-dependent methyltransferase
MAFKYEEAVPWGRSFDDYQHMFHLTYEDLGRSILGCADGPASFNAEMRRKGHRVVSCDPLYQLTAGQIKQRIDATYDDVIGQTRRNQEKFVWDLISSPDELGRVRLEAMHDFLGDYEKGREEGRYIAAELPDLPFAPLSFDLALCSHFLFLYSDFFSLAFHQQAVDELCRVAREVRIFPLLTYNAEPCPFVAPILDHLRKAGRIVSVEKVPYEFQRGGNTMMKIVNRLVA